MDDVLIKILAIETSCDETAAAVIEAKGGKSQPHFKILSNIVSSQIKIHRPYGGVVPNLAKRSHQRNLVPVLKKTLEEAKLLKKNPKSKIRNPKQIQNTKYKILNTILEREEILKPKVIQFLKKYQTPKINLIAVTRGPGLAPALWPGVNFAKALAYFWQKPIIGINHLEGHILANWLKNIPNTKYQIPNTKISFPIVSLIVSGGHTQLVLMKDLGKYKLIGETRDDAAGECFDKVARILGLGYPGGPAIAAAAAKFRIKNSQLRIKLPRPMINTKDYDFSFSGLKTAVLYLVKNIEKTQKMTAASRSAIAAECQQAVIDVLISKTLRAAKNFHAKTVILAGGVAANKELRRQFVEKINKELPTVIVRLPLAKFCTDNASMIAAAAYFHTLKKDFTDWEKLTADANLRLI